MKRGEFHQTRTKFYISFFCLLTFFACVYTRQSITSNCTQPMGWKTRYISPVDSLENKDKHAVIVVDKM